jgi:hypothetical protein
VMKFRFRSPFPVLHAMSVCIYIILRS